MGLRRRLICMILALMFLFCAGAQAAGYEYIFENPVLYVDDVPVFILENLSVSAGMRDDGGTGAAWLDVLAGGNTALRSTISKGDNGIFASLGGIPHAYGLSGNSFALLTGAENSLAAYELYTPENLAGSLKILLKNMLTSMETGSETQETAPLAAGDTAYTAKTISGMADTSAITSAAGSIPALSGIVTCAQVMGQTIPDIGTWTIDGSWGESGDSIICNLTAVSDESTYNITIILDESASPSAASLSITGPGTDLSLSASSVSSQYATAKVSGSIPGAWTEAEFQYTSTGDFQFGGGIHFSENNETNSATIICQGGEFYYAVSRDIAGVEKNAYLTSDTVLNEDGSRSGIATIGAYDPEGRVELVADVTMLTGDEIGAGRKVDTSFPNEIFAMNTEGWNNLKNSLVNVVNGAMYVISLHVPGFTYETIDSLDISGLISGEAE